MLGFFIIVFPAENCRQDCYSLLWPKIYHVFIKIIIKKMRGRNPTAGSHLGQLKGHCDDRSHAEPGAVGGLSAKVVGRSGVSQDGSGPL